MINYHKTVHNNDKIQVSPWQPEYFDPSDMQPSSSRSVTMYQTFEAPAWVRRAAGGSLTLPLNVSTGRLKLWASVLGPGQ